jgi:hypothetical protein
MSPISPWLGAILCLLIIFSVCANFSAPYFFTPSFSPPIFPHEESPTSLRYFIRPFSREPSLFDHPPCPPLRVFVYDAHPEDTTECLYPSDMPTRYINTTLYWFQRMLEPTVHQQFLYGPMRYINTTSSLSRIIPGCARGSTVS